MNERILELSRDYLLNTNFDADGYEYGYPHYEFEPDELVKFVELIVQECADQIVKKGTDCLDWMPSQTGVRPEYWDMAKQIKQHFGIEK